MTTDSNRVLITGGAGFIGSHLAEYLVKLGYRVTVVDDLSTGSQENLGDLLPQIELVVGDIAEILQNGIFQLEQFSLIFHLAANPYIPPSVENPLFDYRLNLHNTLILLEALRSMSRSPRLINVSSAAVYGNPSSLPIRETDPTVPISPYGVSKLAAERYVSVYSQIYGIPATSVRLFSVYGPKQHKQVIYDLLVHLRKNPPYLEVLGDGSQSRDFTYVDDVVRAMSHIATEAPAKGEVFNVASGKTHSISDMVSHLCHLHNRSPEVKYTGKIRYGDAEKWVVDISRLRQLGFQPQTTLEDGLVAVKAWYDGISR